MNYTRRANRPDANYYRDTRRRGLKREMRSSRRRRGGNGASMFVVFAIVVSIGVAAWMIWG